MFKYSIIIRWHLGWLSRTRSCASHGSSHGVYIGWMLKALRKSQNPRSKRSLWSTDQFDKSTCLGQQELRSNREGGSNPSSHVFQLDTTCVQTDSNHRHSLTLLPSLFAQSRRGNHHAHTRRPVFLRWSQFAMPTVKPDPMRLRLLKDCRDFVRWD